MIEFQLSEEAVIDVRLHLYTNNANLTNQVLSVSVEVILFLSTELQDLFQWHLSSGKCSMSSKNLEVELSEIRGVEGAFRK